MAVGALVTYRARCEGRRRRQARKRAASFFGDRKPYSDVVPKRLRAMKAHPCWSVERHRARRGSGILAWLMGRDPLIATHDLFAEAYAYTGSFLTATRPPR